MGVLDLTKKNAFVFPGQGAQGAGMGKDLADNFPAAKEIFEKADEILGFSLSDLCFNGPDADLNITVNTQPALYVTSAAAWKAADSMGIKAVCAAGHSVGEYVALCAAGAFTFEEGLRLIRKRAEFMNKYAELRPGSMAAVLGLAPEKVAEIAAEASVAGIVTAANFNSPIQTVISGEKDAVAKACELAKAAGARRALPLKVSGGFHSALMAGAAEEMAAVVAEA
ncbi:MAG: ACP S-malonyltransferase, partial [Abditibacteriota bacterium]|nr:ACP S-malonyltransferase [Abditibacteriota bacterium]